MKIYPKGWVEPATTGPLVVDEKKKESMVKKAKELFDKPIEEKDLADKIEQHYVSLGEHYTSAQIKEVVDQVKEDLKVEVAVEL